MGVLGSWALSYERGDPVATLTPEVRCGAGGGRERGGLSRVHPVGPQGGCFYWGAVSYERGPTGGLFLMSEVTL